jgi:propanol-preferring alcohol dehydrogenase
MKAMQLTQIMPMAAGAKPLTEKDLPVPTPGNGEVLIQVEACGVCHTELDEIEGRTPPPALPVIPGHQVVGKIVDRGAGVDSHLMGQRVGVAWFYSACGQCAACRRGFENLCTHFRATGRDANGGYAEYMLAPVGSVYPIPPRFSAAEAAPLLCAGAVGYRSLRLTGISDGQSLGLTGFGASAHLVLQMARQRFPNSRISVFARNQAEQEFARQLGAAWAGDTQAEPPELLDAIIDTTPAWLPVVAALGRLAPGGRLVINAIRKEDRDQDALLKLAYPEHLWMEKEIKSVANVTRRDVSEFLDLAAEIPLRPEIQPIPLKEANRALWEISSQRIRGAKVLIMD